MRCKNNNPEELIFKSRAEFLSALDKPFLSSWKERRGSEDPSVDAIPYTDAVQLFKNGDKENAAQIKKALGRIPKTYEKIDTYRIAPSVRGFMPCVSNYNRGLPCRMLDFESTTNRRQKKILDIRINVAVPYHVTQNEIAEAGAKIASAIQALELNGYRCNVFATKALDMNYTKKRFIPFRFEVPIKEAGAPLNLALLAFPLMNAGFCRRLGFRLVETHILQTGSNEGFYGYVQKDHKANINLYEDMINEGRSLTTESLIKSLTE